MQHWRRCGGLLLGTAALDQGDPVAARADLEQSLALSAGPQPATALSAAGLHPQIESLARLMRVLWLLGYADQAQQCSQDALALAQHVGHPLSVAYAAYFVTTLAQCRRDVVATLTQAEALMALAQEQGRALIPPTCRRRRACSPCNVRSLLPLSSDAIAALPGRCRVQTLQAVYGKYRSV